MKTLLRVILSSSLLICSEASGQSNKELQEVTVLASRTVNNSDGYTTNLRGSDLTAGKAAMDILPFLPNITSENNVFKINGLSVSAIYVDGIKLVDISELANIPGERIDKVQVKYLAGADQSAALSGGSIYITLRRPPEGGYYGSIKASAEWQRASGFGNEDFGAMINGRYKNLSVYDNFSVAGQRMNEHSEQEIDRVLDNDIRITETSKSKSFDFYNRLSLTQQFHSGAQLGGSYLLSFSNPRPNSISITQNSVESICKHLSTVMQEGTLRFSLSLNSKGAQMELVADYFNRNGNNKSKYFKEARDVGKVKEENDLNMWKFKADFTYPYSRRLIWKFGASAQFLSNSYTPSDIFQTGYFSISDIPTKTKGFIPLVYASAQGMAWRIRYSAGVAFQANRVTYDDRSTKVSDHNTQWGINPTIQLMMPLGSQMRHALMLSYKRTLSDIPYSAISSTIVWNDAYNYSVGNKNLKAQSVDMVMAGVSLFQNRLNLTALYARSHNRIFWQTFTSADNPDVLCTMPVNLQGQNQFGFGAEWSVSPLKGWRLKLAGRLEITNEDNTVGSVYYNKIRCKEYFSLNNSFRFKGGWGGMLNASVEPTYHYLDRIYHCVYYVTGSVYKTLSGDKFRIAVDFSPLGNRRRLDRRVGDTLVKHKYTSPVQYIGLSLTWNFSGGKDVDVDVVDGIQNYTETSDTL